MRAPEAAAFSPMTEDVTPISLPFTMWECQPPMLDIYREARHLHAAQHEAAAD